MSYSWILFFIPPIHFKSGRFSKEISLLKKEAKKAKIKAKNLPKKFKYYCPKCLFQTNTKYKICPKCGMSRLLRCEGDESSDEEYETYKYYCPRCLFQSNEKHKICPECKGSKLLKCKSIGE